MLKNPRQGNFGARNRLMALIFITDALAGVEPRPMRCRGREDSASILTSCEIFLVRSRRRAAGGRSTVTDFGY
jgi:hypothetical protein